MLLPADELVDVVDSENRVIGQVTRREMRARNLPHRCVYILVFSTRGELYIHQRTATKDINPSKWDLAVGGVPAVAESSDEAAKRELLEELGVVAPLEPLFPFLYADETTIAHAFVYRTTSDGPFRLQPTEVVRGEFVKPADLAAHTALASFCPAGLAIWDEYLKRFPIDR